MNKEQFIKIAGGVYKSKKDYEYWDGSDKKTNFWDFFNGQIITKEGTIEYDKEILSFYGGIPVETLIERDIHSIEHIIPKDFLNKYLKKRYYTIRRGATINPFNFAPCHRTLNTVRSTFPYDFEGDKVTTQHKTSLTTEFTDYGFDDDAEWVVPAKTKGDVARAILYMCLIYDITGLYSNHVDELVSWAKSDLPTFWEIKYNQWVHMYKGINNPFIRYVNTDATKPYSELLDDDELLNAIRGENTVAVDPSTVTKLKVIERKKVAEGTIKIVAALVNPDGKDAGNETISLFNTSPDSVFLKGWQLINKKKKAYYFGEEHIASGEFKTIKLPENALKLSNRGDIIQLLDEEDKTIHKVKYTSAASRKKGWQVVF
jgi:hypothetical protein